MPRSAFELRVSGLSYLIYFSLCIPWICHRYAKFWNKTSVVLTRFLKLPPKSTPPYDTSVMGRVCLLSSLCPLSTWQWYEQVSHVVMVTKLGHQMTYVGHILVNRHSTWTAFHLCACSIRELWLQLSIGSERIEQTASVWTPLCTASNMKAICFLNFSEFSIRNPRWNRDVRM